MSTMNSRAARALTLVAVLGFPAHAFAYGEFAYPATGKLAARPAGSPNAIEITIDYGANGYSWDARAARAGTVTSNIPVIVLQHENGYETRYELYNVHARVGEQPRKGDPVGSPSGAGHPFRFHVARYGAEQLVPGNMGDVVKRGDPIPATYPGLPAVPVLPANPFADHLYMAGRDNGAAVTARPYDDAGHPQHGLFTVTDPVFAKVIDGLHPGMSLISLEARAVGSALEIHHVNATLQREPFSGTFDIPIYDAPKGHRLPLAPDPTFEDVKILEFQLVGNESWFRIQSKRHAMIQGWVWIGNLDYLSKVGIPYGWTSSGSGSSSGTTSATTPNTQTDYYYYGSQSH